MPNLYRVFIPVDNVDAIEKIAAFATDLGLPNYVRSDRTSNDLLVFTVNGGQRFYFHINGSNDCYLEPLSTTGSDMTALNISDVVGYTHGLAISEIHMIGYDDPKSMYVLMKRSDGVWLQLCLGYCHPIGVHSGCFVASLSNAIYDGYGGCQGFPTARYSYSWMQQPMFGGWNDMGNSSGYVNVDIGNGATDHWHVFADNRWGSCAVSPILYSRYDYTGYPHYEQQSTFGWHKLRASRQGFGWNTHLVSVPFLVRDPDGYFIPVGYAPNIRAVRSQEHTVFDKVTSAGEDYWIFPMLRHSTYKVNTISSGEYFWAFRIFTGQESPVLI